jgi:hypothetical protein
MTPQSVASVVRQVLAIAAIVMGALTSALQGIHLPPAVSAVLAAGGLVLLNLEHYLSDPSTGNPVTTTTTTTATPAPAPPAPVPVPAPPIHSVP